MKGLENLRSAQLVFWDFDGVIKDSVSVKTRAFQQMFSPYGEQVLRRVVEHHEEHGGVSRYKKIPLYFREYAGVDLNSTELVRKFEDFSLMVKEAVIDSPWVPGIREYLRENCFRQKFMIVTGTPQAEIEDILMSLELNEVFINVYGAPICKTEAVKRGLTKAYVHAEESVFVGDSITDWEAARENGVQILFRETSLNKSLIERHKLPFIIDFLAAQK